jgi:glycosyltransferase involved in cell wall biosynthesis
MADVEKLCQALCEYAEHPELAEKCGRNAQDVLTRFAPGKLLNQWNEYILSITAKKK